MDLFYVGPVGYLQNQWDQWNILYAGLRLFCQDHYMKTIYSLNQFNYKQNQLGLKYVSFKNGERQGLNVLRRVETN